MSTGQLSAEPSFDPRERFARLLQRFGAGAHVENVWSLLLRCYSEPDRHYHNLDHIRTCLERLDEVRDSLRDPDAAELALWFHDAVYEPTAVDNELRSALLFDRQLGVFLPTERADHVHAMIMATVHPSDSADNDARFVADIDLAGFAQPRGDFMRVTGLLRRECIHLTDSQFQLGTLAFFRKILGRPTIYLTEYFLAGYEQRARRNLCDLVGELEAEQAAKTGQ
ncbi:MAG: hypothetical protein WAL83_11715 [Arenicellales bacterium]